MPMVPISWLRDHVDVPAGTGVEELAADLVRVGLEEEEIHPARVTGPLVVGHVLTMERHMQSNGKEIAYARVDVGVHNDEPGTGKEPSDLPSRGIICGAPNLEVGQHVVVALPGAVLPGPFPITARKTYGHISDGMICSVRELGLGEDHTGIIVLDEAYAGQELPPIGTDIIPFLGLGEEILEINVTPDRGYCFSMRGIAREYSHSTGAAFRDPGLPGTLVAAELPATTPDGFPVEVADDAPIRGQVGCDRFVTRLVRGIDATAKAPEWMVQRLEMAGMRSISLAVDVTNYVMLDLGQPMHAYDMAALEAPIVVRRARAGEKLTTLDDAEHELEPEDLLITDSPDAAANGKGSRIIGMAGVMGGQYSEVEDHTTDIVLECAHFDSISVARTSRRHKIFSESAKRYERGVDPLLPAVAAQRAVDLLVEYGGGTADDGVFDLNTTEAAAPIHMAKSEPLRLTGVDYADERVVELLEMIGCDVAEARDGDGTSAWRVMAPSWRPDLTGPAHLVEEIARLDGYDNIPSLLPAAPAGTGLTAPQSARRLAAETLAQQGITEVESYPFLSDSFDRQRLAADDPRRQAVVLRNPLADDAPTLRTSILDSLLDVAGRNVSRGQSSVAVFETGLVAHPKGAKPGVLPSAEQRPSDMEMRLIERAVPKQPWHVGIVLAGTRGAANVLNAPRNWDWGDAVQLTRDVAAALGIKVEVTRAWLPEYERDHKAPPIPAPDTDPQAVAPWHPGRVARVFVRAGKTPLVVGMAGELDPAVCRAFGLPKRSCAVELDLEALIGQLADAPIQVKPVSTYPVAKEDIALVVDADIPVSRVEQVVRQGAGALAESVTLFDIYQGDQVSEGKRSLAFALVLRAPDRTLSADEVAAARNSVIKRASKTLGAELRS